MYIDATVHHVCIVVTILPCELVSFFSFDPRRGELPTERIDAIAPRQLTRSFRAIRCCISTGVRGKRVFGV